MKTLSLDQFFEEMHGIQALLQKMGWVLAKRGLKNWQISYGKIKMLL